MPSKHRHTLISHIDRQIHRQVFVQQKKIMLQALWNTGHIRDALHRSPTSITITHCFYHLRLQCTLIYACIPTSAVGYVL